MQYKFEFMQHDWVPTEHLEMDKNRRKQSGLHELFEKVSQDYEYTSRVLPDGKIVYGIELVVMNAQKYNRGLNSIERILCYHPDLQRAVLDVIRDADFPDVNPERFANDPDRL